MMEDIREEMQMNPTHMNRNDCGFADVDDITGMCEKISYIDDADWQGGSGINVISDGNEGYIYDTDASTLVVGATASGKTRRVLLPYVYSCIKAGTNMVLNDPKGEIYSYTCDLLKKEGYNVRILDYRNPMRGERYNPLEYPAKLYRQGKRGRAMELFSTIGETLFNAVKSEQDPFWHLTGTQYFVGLSELLSENFDERLCTINNIYNIHLQGEEKAGPYKRFRSFFSDIDRKKKNCWKLLCPTVMAPNETQGGITSMFTSAISAFVLNEDIMDQTADSTFQLQELVDQKTALFLVTRDEGSAYDRLISVIINQIYEYLVDTAEEISGGCLKRRVEFILDEFGNLPAIYAVERKLTAGRSRNIRWLIAIQSLQQLNLIYGRDVANIILGNGAGNLVYLYSPDLELLRYISGLCGTCFEMHGMAEKALLSEGRLRRFDKTRGECLMLLERTSPFVSYLPDISEYPVKLEGKKDITFRDRHMIQTVNLDDIVINELKAKEDAKEDTKEDEIQAGESKNNDITNSVNVYEMIKEIDAKIAEYRKEENVQS